MIRIDKMGAVTVDGVLVDLGDRILVISLAGQIEVTPRLSVVVHGRPVDLMRELRQLLATD